MDLSSVLFSPFCQVPFSPRVLRDKVSNEVEKDVERKYCKSVGGQRGDNKVTRNVETVLPS